jgi:hypothetical protein
MEDEEIIAAELPDDTIKSASDIFDSYSPGELEWEAPLQPTPDPDAPQLSQWDAPTSIVDRAASMWVFGLDIDLMAQKQDSRFRRGFQGEFNQPGYAPSADEVLKVADDYELTESYFNKLAGARSPEDLKVMADTFAMRELRNRRMAATDDNFFAFVGNSAIAMLDPAFFGMAGGVEALAAPLQATTRFGNAVRAAAVNAATDIPLEGVKLARDPGYTMEQAAFTVAGSMLLGGALGALSKGGNAEAVARLDSALAREAERTFSGNVGAAQASAVARDPNATDGDIPDPLGDAPEKAGFGSFGTPVNRLARSDVPEVRSLADEMTWRPGSERAQDVTVAEAQRRVFEAGTVFARTARGEATKYFRANKQAARSLMNPFGQPSSEQIESFMETVGKVHAGVMKSDDPHIMAAVRAYQDGYKDGLMYLKNSSYNGPGSEGIPGQSLDEFLDVEPDPQYVMRRFSSPGWRRTLATVGQDRVADKLAQVIWRSNAEQLLDRAVKVLDMKDSKKLPPAEDKPQVSPTAASPPPTGQAAAPIINLSGMGNAIADNFYDGWFDTLAGGPLKSGGFRNEPRFAETQALFKAGKLPTRDSLKALLNANTPSGNVSPQPAQGAPKVPARETGVYTEQELFGGKPPVTRNADAKAFYQAMLKGPDAVKTWLDDLLDPSVADFAEARLAIKAIYEAEGIERGLPKNAATARKRLMELYEDTRSAADAALKDEAPKAKGQFADKAAQFLEYRKAQAEKLEAQRADEARVEEQAYRLARRIATKYVETVARLLNKATSKVDLHAPVTPELRKAAKEVVKDIFNEGDDFADNIEEAIEMVLDLVAPVRKTSHASDRAKQRLRLDLSADLDADILPMWDWNAEALYTTYRRQTSGHAGFLKAGYTRVQEFDAKVERIKESAKSLTEEQQIRIREETELLEEMKKYVLGIPPDWVRPKDENWIWLTTQWRRMNFSRLMNNVGFLSFSEIAGAAVQMGPFRLLKSIPDYRRYIKQIKAGDPKALESIYYTADALLGHGSSQVRARMGGFANRFEDDLSFLDRESSGVRKQIDTFTRKSGNATARMSGMAPLTEWLRSAIVGAESQDWVKAARVNTVPYSARRMKALGVDDAMWQRIAAQLNKMGDVTSPDTGQPRPFIDFSKWDDGEAANVFMNAIDRNSRRLVLEGDLGHKDFLLDRPSMRLLFQFLNFPINAWTKHLTFAGDVRDTRALAEAIFMALGGGIGHMARTAAIAYAAKTVGDERNRYLEEMLSPAEVAKGMFYYSAHGSLIPNAIDLGLSGAQHAGFDVEPLFSKSRASGLAGDPLVGNASRSSIYNMIRTTGSWADGEFSEQDFESFVKAWMPLGNHIATLSAVNAIAEFLPDEEDEDN